MKDGHGETVMTKANPILCRDIARAGGGVPFASSNVTTLSKHVRSELEKLPKAIMDGSQEYDELYGQFLAVAAILLLLAQFVTFRKNRLFRRLKLFDR